MSINKVILLGRVGHAPEIRGEGDKRVAKFSLATSEGGYTRKSDGVQVPVQTEWHSCAAFGRLVQTIEKFVTTGRQLYVEGRIRTNEYVGKDNVKRFAKEIIVDVLELIGSKNDNGNAQPQEQQSQSAPEPAPQPQADPQLFMPSPGEKNDDLPF